MISEQEMGPEPMSKQAAPKVLGYRDLTADEITLMNEAKEMAVMVGDLCDKISKTRDVDQRWAAIGRTDLQRGFMALIRGIARPETF